MSGQPSPSASKNAHPDPNVSGKYFLPARPLLWTKWMPACAVTSVNTGPAGGPSAGISMLAAAREKRTQFRADVNPLDHPHARLHTRYHDRAIKLRRGRRHVRRLAQLRHQAAPILDAFARHFGDYVDVRHGAQQAALQ